MTKWSKGCFPFCADRALENLRKDLGRKAFSDPLRFVFICRNNLLGKSMASALQFQGVQGSLAVRSSMHKCKPQIGFATFGAPVCARSVWGNRMAFSVTCKASASDVIEKSVTEHEKVSSEGETSFTCVMKFGGSSVASAKRMKEVATLILSFPEERPIVVLSAMGKTTNKLLLVFFDPLFFLLVFSLFCFVL